MSLLSQRISRRKPAGTCANNGRLFAGSRFAKRPVRRLRPQILVRSKPLEQTNGDRAVLTGAPADFLTRSRTDSSQDSRQSNIPFNNFNCLSPLPRRQKANHSRNIHPCRTSRSAGTFTISNMIAQQQFQSRPASRLHGRGIRMHLHPFLNHQSTGRHQAAVLFHLYHTEHAAG